VRQRAASYGINRQGAKVEPAVMVPHSCSTGRCYAANVVNRVAPPKYPQAPDLQALVEKFGGYHYDNITPEAWADHDAAMAAWHRARRISTCGHVIEPSSVRVSQLAFAFLEDRSVPSGPGSMLTKRQRRRAAP
jgi:hypothetical protein